MCHEAEKVTGDTFQKMKQGLGVVETEWILSETYVRGITYSNTEHSTVHFLLL